MISIQNCFLKNTGLSAVNLNCELHPKMKQKRKSNISLLAAELLPEPGGMCSNGPGYQAVAASEIQAGGDQRTAAQPGGTTTPASAPTYTPGHPGDLDRIEVRHLLSVTPGPK